MVRYKHRLAKFLEYRKDTFFSFKDCHQTKSNLHSLSFILSYLRHTPYRHGIQTSYRPLCRPGTVLLPCKKDIPWEIRALLLSTLQIRLWPGKGSSSVANEPWKEVRDKTLKRGNVNVLISKPGPVRWKCKQDRVSVLGLFWTICWGSCHGLCSKTARRQTEAGLIPMNLLRTSSKGQ